MDFEQAILKTRFYLTICPENVHRTNLAHYYPASYMNKKICGVTIKNNTPYYLFLKTSFVTLFIIFLRTK